MPKKGETISQEHAQKLQEGRKRSKNLGGGNYNISKNYTKRIAKGARELFREKFTTLYSKITSKMEKLAMGFEIVVARDWEFNEETRQQHRTGKWQRVTKEKEILELLNGTDEGDEDSFHIITLTDPDKDILKYISDQLMGKAPQQIKLDHESSQLSGILAEIRARNKGIINERQLNVGETQVITEERPDANVIDHPYSSEVAAEIKASKPIAENITNTQETETYDEVDITQIITRRPT